MTALTENAVRTVKTIEALAEFDVKASATVYGGGLTAIDSTGYAVPAGDTAGHEVAGVGAADADNSSGSNGDIRVQCYVDRVHPFTTSGAAITDIGKQVYVVDDNTVALSGTTNNVIAGTIVRVDSATSVWVFVPGIKNLGKYSAIDVAHDLAFTGWVGATLIELTATTVDGSWHRALSTNVITLQGEPAISENEVSVMWHKIKLPERYDASGTLKIRIRCKISGAGNDTGSTIDLNVYEQADGAVSSDLCATAAQTLTSSYANYDFTITDAGLVAGDILNIKLTTDVTEDAASAIYAEIDKTTLLYQRV